MALAELKFYSETLGINTAVNVILPQKSVIGEIGTESAKNTEEMKCLYLLHGLSDDYTIWLRRTSIERYAQKYGICVVMPDGNRSFYTDMKYGGKYYTYIAKELPKLLKTYFNISEKRENNFIAGLSMGGYGALKIALRENKFSAAAGLSSVADVRAMEERFKNDYISIFGEDVIISEDEDLFSLAKKAENNKDKPRIFMAVGTEDFMYKENVKLKETFEKLDYDYTYIEEKGSHDWGFWDKHIQNVLKWMFE